MMGTLLLQRRLRRRQPRDRHPEWTAAHVVEADLVAELDGIGLAAVLAADADFEIRLGLAAALDPELHEAADAVEIDDLEWVFGDQVVLHVGANKAAVVVSAHTQARLRQVVGAEAEEL